MADNISVTQGSGKVVATDEVTDGVLGTVQVQYTKLMDGTIDSTNKLVVTSGGAAKVDGSAVTQPVSGTVAVSNFPETQPVSGTVTAIQPTGTNLHAVVDSGTLTAVTAITNPLPAGTNVIGHIIADSGSTTAVTGNVTAVQPTGTNLHVVVDTAPTTAVTQSTSPWVENVSQFGGSAVSLGSKVSASSMPVVVASDQGAIPVTGTFFPATQPVSGTVTANQGTSPWVENISQLAGTAISVNNGLSDAGTQRVTLAEDSLGQVEIIASSLSVTGTAAAAAALTVTLPAVASQFHYITGIEIEAYSTVARTGSATPVIVTSTNLPGSNAWTFASAAAIGTTDTKWFQWTGAIKSSVANTNTTIVCPATTSVLWRVNVYYYTAE